MQAPDFWRHQGPIARALEPVAALYSLGGWLRWRNAAPQDVGVPVICVGNVIAGGAGKTPVALDLLGRIAGAHALLRGYGGSERGPLRVEASRHTYEQVGDEALLLARAAPTWIARDRLAGGQAAVAGGASTIVMDDGFQNPALKKALSLLVVDGGYGFGNRRVIPSGPLREPLERALKRADAVILMGPDETNVRRYLPDGLPVLTARLEPDAAARGLAGRAVVAFAGIGRPGKFFSTLRGVGARVLATHPFTDHYPYAPTDIQPILDEAFGLGALPVTTAKDAVRLPPDQRQQVDVVGVSVVWDSPAALDALLTAHGLTPTRQTPPRPMITDGTTDA